MIYDEGFTPHGENCSCSSDILDLRYVSYPMHGQEAVVEVTCSLACVFLLEQIPLRS